MPLTTYGETFLLKKLFGQTVDSRSTNYLGLGFGSDADGILSEISEVGYERSEITPVQWDLSSSTLINNVSVNLSTTSASFGSPTSWGIFDASTAGNCLFTGVINPTQEIEANQQIYFPVGELNLSLSGFVSGSGITAYWKELLLTDLVGKTNSTPPTMYVGFSSSTDLETTITGETFSGGYARELFGASEAVVEDTGKAVTSNSSDISFTVSGSWGTDLVRMFIATDSTATGEENLVIVGAVTSMSPILGDIVTVAANAFKVTVE